MKISIIGTGIYGIALGICAADNNHDIMMWSENKELVDNFQKNHSLEPITDVDVPTNINVTTDLNKCLEAADLIILATSAKYVRSMCQEMKAIIDITTPICIASKGIENDTCYFLSDVVKTVLKVKHVGVISGPTFAFDLINKEPCALTLATNSKSLEMSVGQALSSKHLKLRRNNDINGTEICGSIKNVIAIAAGIIDGLGYAESTRAFLITESIHDIKELLSKLKCNPKTVLSFAGIGDLILTCSSEKSRNYKFGQLLGTSPSKEKIKDYLDNNTTEGYYTLLSIKDLTKHRKINMPVVDLIYDIVINNENPSKLIDFLINKN